jgi:polyhydroxyalkanoate synthesis repressor PhaR
LAFIHLEAKSKREEKQGKKQMENNTTAQTAPATPSKRVRTIKRYQNRKLYDTNQSCYVTLEEIAYMIRDGQEIEVLDNKSRENITYSTQIQLLFDQERKTPKIGDVELLKRVIRCEEGTLTGYIDYLEQKLADMGVNVAEERADFLPKRKSPPSVTGPGIDFLSTLTMA